MFFLCDGKSNNASNIMDTLIIHTMHYRERVKENRWQPNISVAFAVLLKAWTRRDDGPIRRVGETFCGSDDEAGKAEAKSSGQNWNSVSDPLQRCLYCIRRAVGMILLCTVLYSKCQHALCQLLGVLWATAPPPGIEKMHSVTVGHDRARGVTSLFCLDYGRCCLSFTTETVSKHRIGIMTWNRLLGIMMDKERRPVTMVTVTYSHVRARAQRACLYLTSNPKHAWL